MFRKTLGSFLTLQSPLPALHPKSICSLLLPSLQRFSTTQGRGFRRSPPKDTSKTLGKNYNRNSSSEFSQQDLQQNVSKSSFNPTKKISKYNVNQPRTSATKYFSDDEADSIASLNDSKMPFDLFTERLAMRSEEEIQETVKELKSAKKETKETLKIKGFVQGLPWSSGNNITKQPEENLSSIVGAGRLINEEVVRDLFKRYLDAIEGHQSQKLKDLLEHSFWLKCTENMKELKERECQIKLENRDAEESKFDLFKVSNFFCVGVHSANRKRNLRDHYYHIFDNEVQGSPMRNIIKRGLSGKEKAEVRVILDLTIESPILMRVYDKEGNVVAGKSEEVKMRYHHMRIENSVLEMAYSTLKKEVMDEVVLNDSSIKSFKYTFSHKNWKIIDFDGYMGGNEYIKDPLVRE